MLSTAMGSFPSTEVHPTFKSTGILSSSGVAYHLKINIEESRTKISMRIADNMTLIEDLPGPNSSK
jgi:hypothetical protein